MVDSLYVLSWNAALETFQKSLTFFSTFDRTFSLSFWGSSGCQESLVWHLTDCVYFGQWWLSHWNSPMDANSPHSLSYCWIINTVFNFKKEIKQRQNSFWQHWIWHYPDENQFMFYIRYNFAPIYMPDYSREKEEARAGYLCPDLFFSLEI